jgi:two-component sensor histidine kinase
VLVQMLRSQYRQVGSGPETLSRDEACEIIRDAMGKVAGIAHLHRLLADHAQADTIEIGDLLIAVIREVVSSLALRHRLRVTQKLSADCTVGKADAQKISMIVVEILMNAIKHAHPTGVPIEMRVACTPTNGGILLEFDDDGVGLPEGFNVHLDGGVGFKTIRMLARELGAALQIESDYLGLSFRLHLPLSSAAAAS